MTEYFHDCRVVRSARRRTIAVVLLTANGEAELRVPLTATTDDLTRAWEQFAPWLERKRRELAAIPPANAPFAFDFRIGGHFFFMGRELELVQAPAAYNSRLIRLDGDKLIFPVADPVKIVMYLEAFYRWQASKHIPGKAGQFAAQFGITCSGVSINGAEHRYGSCSQRGKLNFSWRLMMYPERLIDLVICHELTHRSEMNHSAAFYRVLASYVPDWEAREKELKEWSVKLSNYRLAAQKVLSAGKNAKKSEDDLQKGDFRLY